MLYVLIALFLAALSWILTWRIRSFSLARSIIDIPNHRSSHQVPTPRGGGLAFVFSFLLIIPFLFYYSELSLTQNASILIASLFIAAIGFADDLGHVSAASRLIVHFIASVIVLYGLGGMAAVGFYSWIMPMGLTANFLAAFYLVWMINLYNFMDGVDALAAVEALSVCLGGALLYVLSGNHTLAILPLFLAASVCGFLWWNFPPARIFMGDCGSGFLGLVIGFFSLQAALVNASLFWAWIILLGVFIVDATGTLLLRLMQGYKLTDAHCTHAYQKASRCYGHFRVSFAVLLINLIWLLPIALLVGQGYIDGLIGIAIAYLPLFCLLFKFKAGKKIALLLEK
ncbi:MraY family glycosyltransferase [Legionella londiniensis]|uniref:Alpha-N-acetylglucosaminyltransferase n=1 Tax=Legionella londiniensis TaxID=45068 RepID=A0A0W0VKM2_9GAMM|nr:glycosyltransferase family 4 protein [Legionella londiniensis]KTD20660.1 alpha-N-acetylglucosaminyltransferase [Legionella londiniensis]STX92869.1 alpha-N-acetylglucosaminyltransferase [Legionella londiniensis]